MFNDDVLFNERIQEELRKNKNVDHEILEKTTWESIEISHRKISDLRDRDDDIYEITLESVPMKLNGVGSFVYYSSLITAVGRSVLVSLIS